MAANDLIGSPQAVVYVWPSEGGFYSVGPENGRLLSVNVDKNIRTQEPGRFQIAMAPGGPQGVNSGPTWAQLLTPMSLVAIGMRRGSLSNIVMIGVVVSAQESQVWETGRGVERVTVISGADFQYFFTQFGLYNLTALGAVNSSLIGSPSQWLASLDKAFVSAGPDSVGSVLYNDVMIGSGAVGVNAPQGLMWDTIFQYYKRQVRLFDILSTWFQPYSSPVGIPVAAWFLATDETWYSKFVEIFPFPWYEFFITTAPAGFYGTSSSQPKAASVPIDLTANGFAKASPQLVARVNPLPWTNSYTGSPNQNPSFSLDSSAWQSLPTFNLFDHGFMSSSVGFSADGVGNFFMMVPTFALQLFGNLNSNISPFIFQYGWWMDPSSIHRYGYRPVVAPMLWWSDPTGTAAVANNKQSGLNFGQFVLQVALRLTSYYEPIPLMAHGSITTTLRPDILPGCKFQYAPFKGGTLWDFYITGISHKWNFGRPSTTTLTLERGLPDAVYNNSSLLTRLHVGTAVRVNGEYAPGLIPNTGPGLTALNTMSPELQQRIGEIAQIYVSPLAQ